MTVMRSILHGFAAKRAFDTPSRGPPLVLRSERSWRPVLIERCRTRIIQSQE